jgi:hypothetical protein
MLRGTDAFKVLLKQSSKRVRDREPIVTITGVQKSSRDQRHDLRLMNLERNAAISLSPPRSNKAHPFSRRAAHLASPFFEQPTERSSALGRPR